MLRMDAHAFAVEKCRLTRLGSGAEYRFAIFFVLLGIICSPLQFVSESMYSRGTSAAHVVVSEGDHYFMPHERIREENRKKVINEAARLFLENGLEMVNLDMIASAAGLSKRSVQNYFTSKDDIILEVFHLDEKKQKDNAERYTSTERYQSLSGLEQVCDLLRIALRDSVQHAEEVINLFQLRRYISDKKLLSYSAMELGPILLENELRASIAKGYRDGSIRADVFENTEEMELMFLTISGVLRQFSFYAAMEDERIKEDCQKMADQMYGKFEKHAERLFGVKK